MGLAFGLATYYILRFMRTCGASHDQQARCLAASRCCWPGPSNSWHCSSPVQGHSWTTCSADLLQHIVTWGSASGHGHAAHHLVHLCTLPVNCRVVTRCRWV